MLGLENIGMRLGGRWVLRALSFELNQGDSLIVLGPNGTGKSTLLKVISGLWQPTEGRIQRPGPARSCIGYSAVDLHAYPNLTASEHLALAGNLREIEPRSESLLERVGLCHAADKPVGEFSTGMRVRLKLAMSIQHEPPILLLDEPGAALDEAGRAIVKSIVDEQLTRGLCIIATNDSTEHSLGNCEVRLA